MDSPLLGTAACILPADSDSESLAATTSASSSLLGVATCTLPADGDSESHVSTTSMAFPLLGEETCTLLTDSDYESQVSTTSMPSNVRTTSPSTFLTSPSLSSTDPPSSDDDTYPMVYTKNPRTCRENSLVANPSTSATSSDSEFSFHLVPTLVTASASKTKIDPSLISVSVNASRYPIDPTPTSLTTSASKSPIDFAATLITGIHATFADISASNALDGGISRSVALKSLFNIAPTLDTTSYLTEGTVCASDSLIASPSSSDSANTSKSPVIRPSRDSTSPASSLRGFKRPLSSFYTSTPPLKQSRSEVIVDSEAMNNTKSINEISPVSIRPDRVPKLFRPFEDLIEPVSLCKSEESKYQTDWDIASVPDRECNFSGSSQQVAPDVTIIYPENTVSNHSLDEVTDPTSNFQDQDETEYPSGNQMSTFHPTFSLPSYHGSPTANPITKALDIVQTCASITMKNVRRRSGYSEYAFNRGNDTNNKFFANEANYFLRSLPENVEIECKGFMLQFLEEILIYSGTHGFLTD